MSRKFKVQFKHYMFQTVITGLGLGTFGAIVFTLVTIIKKVI